MEWALDPSQPPTHVLTRPLGISLSRAKMRCLAQGSWLNDEVINAEMLILDRRAAALNRRVLFWPTHFYSKLVGGPRGYDFSNVKRWTSKRQVDVCSLERIVVPVHGEAHFCVCVVDLTKQRFDVYDSLSFSSGSDATGKASRIIDNVARWLHDEMLDKHDAAQVGALADSVMRAWTRAPATPRTMPQQDNLADCGVFACAFAASYGLLASDPLFLARDMPLIRQRLVLDLVMHHDVLSSSSSSSE